MAHDSRNVGTMFASCQPGCLGFEYLGVISDTIFASCQAGCLRFGHMEAMLGHQLGHPGHSGVACSIHVVLTTRASGRPGCVEQLMVIVVLTRLSGVWAHGSHFCCLIPTQLSRVWAHSGHFGMPSWSRANLLIQGVACGFPGVETISASGLLSRLWLRHLGTTGARPWPSDSPPCLPNCVGQSCNANLKSRSWAT